MTSAIFPVGWSPEVAGASSLPSQPLASVDFADLLKSGGTSLVASSNQASSLLTAYAAGADVAPHELVMAMEQAKMSLQLAVEVRNRVVDAYQELTRLQI